MRYNKGMRIPVSKPFIPQKAYTYLKKTLDDGWISSQGPFVHKFENAFARYHEKKHAITTTSGTSALHLALAAAGIGKGDEVIVPAFTMIAPVFAVLYTGAVPVLVDCEPDIFTMNPALIQKRITKKTKAIIVVHIYGHPADMDSFKLLAKKNNLILIEDSAEALGALYKKKKAGSLSDMGCFSFYANKLISTGEGGIIITDNDKYAEKIRSLKNMAHSPKLRFLHTELAYNYRFTSLQAAVGLAFLEKIIRYNTKKRTVAEWYYAYLNDVSGISLPLEKEWAESSFWMYAVLLNSDKISKQSFVKKLAEKGIETRDFFIPMHRQPALLKLGLYKGERFEVADDISKRGIYLPSGPDIEKKDVEFVCSEIRKILL